MQTKDLNAIRDQLKEKQPELSARAERLRAELAEVDEEAARVDAALAALSGTAPKAVGNGSKIKRSKRGAQTPSAKKANVIAAMRQILEREELMEADALKKQVEAQLSQEGFNRFGLAMRWNEARHDPQFVETPRGFRLNEELTAISPVGKA